MSELIETKPPELPVVTQSDDGNLLVVAEHPGELQQAQSALIAWFARKVETLKTDLSIARNELENARKCMWRPGPFQKMVRDLELQHTYYEKALAAVEEGYCIVPNFPVDVVAIRTVCGEPEREYREANWGKPTIETSTEMNPVGEGRYVAKDLKVEYAHTDTDDKGSKHQFWKSTEFRDVALPVKFMKPKVLAATQHAMALNIFDEVAVLPARRKSDPIVVGRILGPKDKVLTFMLAWFIDSKDL